MRILSALLVLSAFALSGAALAQTCDVMRPCVPAGVARHATRAPARAVEPPGRRWPAPGTVAASLGSASAVVAHPAGCPSRAFCGCGASVRVFGHPVRGLYLSSNWLRFPRASPGPGMVAARRGHVFVLEQHVQGDEWLVYDANSGGHQTRVHHRSIRGFSIVNPRA